MSIGPYLLYLPDIALEKIFSFLTYDEVAKNREVSKKFNEIGSKYLTRAFVQLEKRHATIYKKVKSLLPRRESERRSHPLARHCDILSAVETRISMLNMTFMRYIESNVCCFIPGKVIDEIERVLTLVETAQAPPRTHEFLQELRDISSMAMEHFDEHILPNLKLKPTFKLATTISKPSRVFLVQNSLTDELKKVRKQTNAQKHQLTMISSHILQLCVKIKKQNGKIKMQSDQIKEQERKLQEQQTKIQDQETIIADLKKHVEELDQKFSDLTSKIVLDREELSTITSQCSSPIYCGQNSTCTQKYYRSNIKPRTAQICAQLPLSQLDVERKRKSSSSPEIPPKLSKINDNSSDKVISNLTADETLISMSIKPDVVPRVSEVEDGSKAVEQKLKETAGLRKTLLQTYFISETLESLIKNPITKLKSRKRRNTEEIDLK